MQPDVLRKLPSQAAAYVHFLMSIIGIRRSRIRSKFTVIPKAYSSREAASATIICDMSAMSAIIETEKGAEQPALKVFPMRALMPVFISQRDTMILPVNCEKLT